MSNLSLSSAKEAKEPSKYRSEKRARPLCLQKNGIRVGGGKQVIVADGARGAGGRKFEMLPKLFLNLYRGNYNWVSDARGAT